MAKRNDCAGTLLPVSSCCESAKQNVCNEFAVIAQQTRGCVNVSLRWCGGKVSQELVKFQRSAGGSSLFVTECWRRHVHKASERLPGEVHRSHVTPSQHRIEFVDGDSDHQVIPDAIDPETNCLPSACRDGACGVP